MSIAVGQTDPSISRAVDEARFKAEGDALLAVQRAQAQHDSSNALPKFPEPPSAHFRYATGGYERAVLNYEAELKARNITPDPATLALLDDAHRRIAGVSWQDWQKRKTENNPFSNGYFRQQQASSPVAHPRRPEQDVTAKVAASWKLAIQHYPDCADRNSALYRTMMDIGDRLEKQGNPVVYSTDAPFKVAQMAANELGIAPRP